MLGRSGYSDALALNYTQLVRARFAINDHWNKAWYINPGYPWAAQAGAPLQSILALSDKTIIVVVVTLDGLRRRRALLEITANPTSVSTKLEEIQQQPMHNSIPPLSHTELDPHVLIAEVIPPHHRRQQQIY